MALTGDVTWAAGADERFAPYADRNMMNARGAGGYGSAAPELGQVTALVGRREDLAAHLREAIARDATMAAEAWRSRARAAFDALESGRPGATRADRVARRTERRRSRSAATRPTT